MAGRLSSSTGIQHVTLSVLLENNFIFTSYRENNDLSEAGLRKSGVGKCWSNFIYSRNFGSIVLKRAETQLNVTLSFKHFASLLVFQDCFDERGLGV